MSKILVVYQSFEGKTKSLAEAAAIGAASTGAKTELKEITLAGPDDLSNTDGVILATTQPFDSMAGDTKRFLEKLWIGRDKIHKDTPFAAIICYKTNPKATEDSIRTISGYLGLKSAVGWLAVKADDFEAGKEHARQLGIAVAQGG